MVTGDSRLCLLDVVTFHSYVRGSQIDGIKFIHCRDLCRRITSNYNLYISLSLSDTMFYTIHSNMQQPTTHLYRSLLRELRLHVSIQP